ncbi:EAL domain-containing protein [Lelliottia sp. SL45]|uniref:EAL domain-containing protein n=1 Tax=Lelliottia sp. SL45 TaxID=2994665 RepID=UPI0022725991|nr:EAL domain-containing protein [Lelliottia sp. SL45]MCY1700963.1 EAL domain-containing protein [Lelliottia sp. SL45]
MRMRNMTTLVTVSIGFSVLLPTLISIWIANYQAEAYFVKELENYSSRVMIRTGRVIQQSKQALSLLQSSKDIPCGRQHIEEMQRIVVASPYVQEVIYTDNLKPLCTSQENHSDEEAFPPPLRITHDGYSVWLRPHSASQRHHYMIVFGSGHYLVVIDSSSLVDEITFGDISAEAAMMDSTHKLVFAGSKALNDHVRQLLETHQSEPLEYNGSVYIISELPGQGITVVAWSALKPLTERRRQQFLIWLPAGIIVSIIGSYFLIRLLRRIQSPKSRLQDALYSRHFAIHYQPIIELRTGKLVGAEALARWPQADGSTLSPDVFVPLAEQTGLITQLTLQVIEKVFEDMGHWLHLNPDQYISVNIAPADLKSGSLLTPLAKLLKKWDVKSHQIAFELTERGFIEPKEVAPAIAAFRHAGHVIYIDDFGTGYSSLSYIQELDVDTLKIDKSFVNVFGNKSVTPYIIQMAKSLNLSMVAEGIETDQQLSWLRAHGVQYGQGWLYSKALPRVEFILWADNRLQQYRRKAIM